ncbi:MAG TPA: serine hydrolase [Deinococcales bacterium]|nr:serine hydrolase [Deinococcales bacterium]
MTRGRISSILEREAAAFSGTVGVYARRLDRSGEALELNADESFPTASVVKLPLLVAALHRVQEGVLDLDGRYPLTQIDQVTGSGVLHVLQPGLQPTLRDLLTLMIVVSDNTATNMVLDALGGREPVNRVLSDWGFSATRVVGKLQLPWELTNDDQKAGQLNSSTPRDTGRLLEKLWRRELLPGTATELALGILEGQQFNETIPRYLPPGTRALHKTGEITGVRNDAGIVLAGDATYAVVLFSRGGSDHREHPDNEGVLALARIAAAIHEELAG